MAKRESGSGTISFNAARNRWLGQYSLPNGKRKQVSGKTRKEAQAKLAQLRREVEAGMHGTTLGELTLQQFAEQVMARKAATLRGNSIIAYRNLIDNHLDGIAHIPLDKLTPLILEQWVTRLLEHSKPTSVKQWRRKLGTILGEAVRLDILPRNPILRVSTIPGKSEEQHPLTIEQVRAVMAATEGWREECLWLLGLFTGMRKAELLGLRWADIDFQRLEIRVQNTLHHYAGAAYTLEQTKSRASRRKLPLPPVIIPALRARLAQQQREHEEVGDAWLEDIPDLVFRTEIGKPYHPSGPRVIGNWRKALKAAGIAFPHDIHDMRHTFATLLLEGGVNVKTVSEWLGHANIGITLDIYGHVTDRMRGEAAAYLNTIAGPMIGEGGEAE